MFVQPFRKNELSSKWEKGYSSPVRVKTVNIETVVGRKNQLMSS